MWTITQQEQDAPDQFLTIAHVTTREEFKKQAEEEEQTIAVNALCEGLKDRSVAKMVGTQVRDSAARAVRIAAETTAVNIKVIDGKLQSRPSKSSKKALVGVSS